jgi:hypothetical protein
MLLDQQKMYFAIVPAGFELLSLGWNFSVLRYEPALKIDPYQRKAWNSAKEIERRF